MAAVPKAITQQRTLPGIGHALLAIDGSPASLRAAARLRLLLEAFPEARLTVLYVAHLPRDLQVTGNGTKLTLEFPLHGLIRGSAAPALQAAMNALGPMAIRAETEVQIGEPAHEICEFARAEQVDLIVVGTRGTAPDGVTVGGVSSRILSLAPCAVMLVQ